MNFWLACSKSGKLPWSSGRSKCKWPFLTTETLRPSRSKSVTESSIARHSAGLAGGGMVGIRGISAPGGAGGGSSNSGAGGEGSGETDKTAAETHGEEGIGRDGGADDGGPSSVGWEEGVGWNSDTIAGGYREGLTPGGQNCDLKSRGGHDLQDLTGVGRWRGVEGGGSDERDILEDHSYDYGRNGEAGVNWRGTTFDSRGSGGAIVDDNYEGDGGRDASA